MPGRNEREEACADGRRRLRWLPGVAVLLGCLAAAAVAQEVTSVAQEVTSKEVLRDAVWTAVEGGARAVFTVKDLGSYGGMTLIPGPRFGKDTKLTLNGKPVAGPLAGMTYSAIPMDPKAYLVPGENVLTAIGVSGPPAVPGQIARLEVHPPQMLAFEGGPVLGAIGPDYFTVTCRTGMPAEVVITARPLEPAGKESSATSPRGFYHRLRLDIPKGAAKFTYTVTCQNGGVKKTEGPFTVRVPGTDAKSFRFVAVGNSGADFYSWGAVAAAALKAGPELVIFTGGAVSDPAADELWEQEFLTPGRGLLSTVPFYPAPGDQENDSPVFHQMFSPSGGDGKGGNWIQSVGGVLFIGVDGADEWSAKSKNVEWLEGVLKDSKDRFIFFVTHYPAWTSGQSGRSGSQAMLASREVIMPVLAKYRATAMLAGHDFDYERNEPPADKGVTCIVTGGAGGGLGKKSGRAGAANPYSKVFAAAYHYCVFDVSADKCEMKVYGLDAKLIDEKTFEAR